MAKLDRTVPEELTRLFDFIDADMDEHALRFQLRRDMLVANNRTIVHGREAFENAPPGSLRAVSCGPGSTDFWTRSQALSLRA